MAECVTEFFKNQNVFITGGTGFMGRVLVEKLLRSCPEIGNIYILMREKKGIKLNERVKEIVNLPLFEILRAQNPKNLKKIIPIPGDCMKLNLGLSESEYTLLEENVSIVFHCAASIRFDDPLNKAIILNTRGTRELMLLARKMRNLKVLVHTSTCYSQCDKKVVEEKFYPAPVDWKKFIEVAETVDEHILDILTKKIIDKLPNTYVFSKSLAEHVVKDLGENIPVVIIRPSIVVSTWNDPIPGWIDNWNGPISMLVAALKGILRSSLQSRRIFDMVPVDFTIRVMCAAAWEKAISRKCEEMAVYNVATLKVMYSSVEKIYEVLYHFVSIKPLEFIWIPRIFVTQNKLLFTLHTVCFQLIPAMFLDFILKLRGSQPILVKLQRKIYQSFIVLSYFSLKSWIFKNDKMMWLGSKVPASDEAFNILYIENLKIGDYLTTSLMEGCCFLLNTIPGSSRAKRNLARMLVFEKIIKVSASILGLWLLFHSGFLQNILNINIA